MHFLHCFYFCLTLLVELVHLGPCSDDLFIRIDVLDGFNGGSDGGSVISIAPFVPSARCCVSSCVRVSVVVLVGLGVPFVNAMRDGIRALTMASATFAMWHVSPGWPTGLSGRSAAMCAILFLEDWRWEWRYVSVVIDGVVDAAGVDVEDGVVSVHSPSRVLLKS